MKNTEPTDSRRDWQDLARILDENHSFVFSTHLQPDADGFGSELGLARYLKRKGKQVSILHPTSLRSNLHFMDLGGEAMIYDREKHADLIRNAEVFIAFDIGHFDRLGQVGEDALAGEAKMISIDHHPGDKSQFDQVFDHPQASSTGVLIYDLFQAMDPEAVDSYAIAHPIYAAMMSDTGNFRFNNTDFETLSAAAHLVNVGVKPYELFVHLYEDLNTPGRLIVLKELLTNIRYAVDNKLAWSVLDHEQLMDQGVHEDDLNSLSDFIRSIKGVEVGIAITRSPGAEIDISLRSKGKIEVNKIAAQFGGGGHAFAAGCRIPGDLEAAEKAVVIAARAAVESWEDND